jgi:CBS domain-containing protein
MGEATILDRIRLVRASVPRDATYGEAVAVLASSEQAAIAVLDADGGVAGLFGPDEALRGCLPRYLGELHHTAFAPDDPGLLAEAAARATDEPVERHMGKPVTVDRDASALHVGEVFLHSRLPAIAVVEKGRFAGMLDRATFARAMIAAPPGRPS